MASKPSTAATHVVVMADSGSERYDMFRVQSLTATRAVVSGGLLLEVGERLSLQLDGTNGSSVLVKASVESVSTAEMQMTLALLDLAPGDRTKLGL